MLAPRRFLLTRGTWQGIVPAKVHKMASDIVDLTVNDLLDLNQVFAQVDEHVMVAHMQQVATSLTPKS